MSTPPILEIISCYFWERKIHSYFKISKKPGDSVDLVDPSSEKGDKFSERIKSQNYPILYFKSYVQFETDLGPEPGYPEFSF